MSGTHNSTHDEQPDAAQPDSAQPGGARPGEAQPLHPADPRRPSGTDFEAAIAAPSQVGGNGPELSDEQVEFLNKLFDMAREGDRLLVEYVKQGVPAEIQNSRGDTFLILAAYSGQGELALALIDEAGADVNYLNQSNQSALTCAVFRGDEPLVRRLLERGAQPDAGSPNAIDAAKTFGQAALLPLLEGK
ncbi:ankyrin repeat domain-containing protein [Pseudoglutamicibacter albus]|uniref:ankyrin repeat domain-containing protein n=1 Tax=Pseudoglutamicibacter albus TaxID=98671 RepID=UPI001C6007E5|nr:ankyrin repeat domain-containing protein [Pseudoglutamicibacter albus]WIK84668.1 ankyrin repeat domain-containing protein [Pseudoglutamicibacter albus]